MVSRGGRDDVVASSGDLYDDTKTSFTRVYYDTHCGAARVAA